jgi:hypothetical protein
MRTRPLLSLGAALALFVSITASAQADDGDVPVCTWQADVAPVFVPGNTTVNDVGYTMRTSTVFGEVVGWTAWEVAVLPGYHFGWVHAFDKGVPLHSSVNKAYARSSYYGVYKTADCCHPQRTAGSMMSCSFRVRAAQLNAPGQASAAGVTHIHAVNSGLSCVATAAATTRSERDGVPLSVQVPLPTGGSAKVSFNLDFDSEEESVDEASNVVVGPARAAPDEEYGIVTDLDLVATADGAPWDHAESTADLRHHTIYIRTVVECGHCLEKWEVPLLVDAAFHGVKERPSPYAQ